MKRWQQVRFVLYIAYAVGGPVLKYTEAKGWTGAPEYDLWLGIGTAVGVTAAANVPRIRQRVTAWVKPRPDDGA